MTDSFVAPDVSPYIRYHDARSAIAWLERVLGFERVALYEGEGDSIDYAVLRFGTGAIQVSSPRGGETAATANPMGIGGLYLVVADPDAAFERARREGAEITRPPTDESYGRGFSLRDPEGVNWSVGDYRPGAD
jgi:uncharacterized glyoxalase superfamily protein PhnB